MTKHVALADLSSERLYVGMEFLLLCALLVRQRRQRPLVTLSRHPDHAEPSWQAAEKVRQLRSQEP
jgi:hypothetical protein